MNLNNIFAQCLAEAAIEESSETDTANRLKGLGNINFTWTPQFLINVVGMTERQVRHLSNDESARDYLEQILIDKMKDFAQFIPEASS